MEICDDEELVISPGPCGGKDVPGPGSGRLAGRAYQDPLPAQAGHQSPQTATKPRSGSHCAVAQAGAGWATGGRGAAKVSLLPTRSTHFLNYRHLSR